MFFPIHLSEEKEKRRLKLVHLALPSYSALLVITSWDQEVKKADLEAV
jgi:hypothetical protein